MAKIRKKDARNSQDLREFFSIVWKKKSEKKYPYEMIPRKERGRKLRKPKYYSPDYDVILNRNSWANKKLIQMLRNY